MVDAIDAEDWWVKEEVTIENALESQANNSDESKSKKRALAALEKNTGAKKVKVKKTNTLLEQRGVEEQSKEHLETTDKNGNLQNVNKNKKTKKGVKNSKLLDTRKDGENVSDVVKSRKKKSSGDGGGYVQLSGTLNAYVEMSLTKVERESVRPIKESDVVVRSPCNSDDDDTLGRYLADLTDTCMSEGLTSALPVIIVSASALRSIHLRNILMKQLSRRHPIKSMKSSKKSAAKSSDKSAPTAPVGTGVAKLFAKHVKLSEQVAYLKSRQQQRHLVAGVGTPHRILALIQEGAISVSGVRYVVLDWHAVDVKKRRLIDMEELRSSILTLLSKYFLNTEAMRDQKCKLVLL